MSKPLGRTVGIALLLVLALLRVLVFGEREAWAHDFRPGVLSLVEAEPGRFDIAWTEPVDTAGVPGNVHIVYPSGCEAHEKKLSCRGPLEGAIAFEGLAAARTKIVVTVRWRDGRTIDGIATGASPLVQIGPSGPTSALQWIRLGTEHVFTGLDHVAFVVGLFLVVGARRRLLFTTVTAFTLAHSLTLALAALHLVELPRAPVEATIAASVLLVAKEAVSSEATLARTRPWLVAFLFGLVHGLGFAGALGELPLPKASFGVALLSFNVGVEIAQLVIVGSLVLASALAARAHVPILRRTQALRATCYVIGALGAWWFFDRAYLVLKR
jgi:HupE / UreJ protein